MSTMAVGKATLVTMVLLGAACASSPPKELENARSAYRDAQNGAAEKWHPAGLHAAERSLKLAEATFEEEGDSARTRDRAYVAQRKAQLAAVEARTLESRARLDQLKSELGANRTQQLAELRDSYAEQQARLEEVRRARKQAEEWAKQATADLQRIAAVKEEPRGTVITLSGSVLFASGESELLPTATAKLSSVAKSLTERAPGTKIIVEGHTDTQGSEEFNLELSTRRAEAVRNFLVSHGVPEDRIETQGYGFSRPLAPNKTAEGRANNRRVEIVVEPPKEQAEQAGGSANQPAPT